MFAVFYIMEILLSLILLITSPIKPLISVPSEIYWGRTSSDEKKIDFYINNRGSDTLYIIKIEASCPPCLKSYKLSMHKIPPKQKAKADVLLNLKGSIGVLSSDIIIHTNDPSDRAKSVKFIGYKNKPGNPWPSKARLCPDKLSVGQGDSLIRIRIRNTGQQALNIPTIYSKDSTLYPESNALSVPLGKTAELRLRVDKGRIGKRTTTDTLVLFTNVPETPRYTIPITFQ